MKSKTNIRTATALAVACSVLFCITGCNPEPEKEINSAAGKLRYTVITIEGRQFIAYRGAQSYIYLAGPIDK